MARRMTKSTRRSDETGLGPLNGTAQPVGSFESDTAASPADEGLPSEIRSRIEALAYEIYLRRGCRHGDDVKDWLEAEQMILDAMK
jgi:hypothetical protein